MIQVDWEYNTRQLISRELFWQLGIASVFEPYFLLGVGGARGGGKSIVESRLAMEYVWYCIEKYNIEPQKDPIPIAWMGRYESTDFSDTTLETFKRFVPQEHYTLREHKKEIVIQDRVMIRYGGIRESMQAKHKFLSGEYGAIFLDQVEEIPRDMVMLLLSTLRKQVNGRPLPYLGVFSFNPSNCFHN